MTTPAAPSGLRPVTVVAVVLLVAVGLVPFHPSQSEGFIVALAGLIGLVLLRVTRNVLTHLTTRRVATGAERLMALQEEELNAAEVAEELDLVRYELVLRVPDGMDALLPPEDRELLEEMIKGDIPPAQQRMALAYFQSMLTEWDTGMTRLLTSWWITSFTLAGVIFLLFWTLVFLLIWSNDPTAFNFAAPPRLGEFLFIAASGVLGGTPEGVEARTTLSQTAVTLELLAAVVVIGGYVAAMRKP